MSLKIMRIVALLLAVLAIGSIGYHVLLGWGWLDSIYFTVITMTTVGFSEIHELGDAGRVFTIILLFGSIGIVTYPGDGESASVLMRYADLALHRAKLHITNPIQRPVG